MQHPDEGLIHAWLDGALAGDEAAQLESHVAACTSCGAIVAEARGLIAASSRIVGHLDAVPAGVIPVARKKNLWLRSPWPSAIAATLIIGVGMFTTRQESTRTMESMALPPAAPVPVAAPTAAASHQGVQPLVTRPAPRVAAAAPPATVTDTVVVSPPAAAMQKAEATTQASPVRAAEIPARSASPAVDTARRARSTELSSVTVTGASAAGAGARSAAPSAPAPTVGAVGGRARTMADQAASEASTTFAGCYEMNVSTDILPARFALVADSAGQGQFAVRYVDAEGRPTERILDATWATEGGQAVIRTAGRGTVLTLVKTGSAVAATSPNGPRTGRVIKCGE